MSDVDEEPRYTVEELLGKGSLAVVIAAIEDGPDGMPRLGASGFLNGVAIPAPVDIKVDFSDDGAGELLARRVTLTVGWRAREFDHESYAREAARAREA